jgi:transcription antitermination factor NusG
MPWACAMTASMSERKAVMNLERQGFHTFCPYFMKRKRGHSVLTWAALFPGYLFIELTERSQWSKINSTYGVIRLLTTRLTIKDPVPLWVPDDFIKNLGDQCQGIFKGMGELPPGTIIRVVEGPFTGSVGSVIGMTSDDRIRIMMRVFNRECVVEFVRDDLEVETT